MVISANFLVLCNGGTVIGKYQHLYQVLKITITMVEWAFAHAGTHCPRPAWPAKMNKECRMSRLLIAMQSLEKHHLVVDRMSLDETDCS